MRIMHPKFTKKYLLISVVVLLLIIFLSITLYNKIDQEKNKQYSTKTFEVKLETENELPKATFKETCAIPDCKASSISLALINSGLKIDATSSANLEELSSKGKANYDLTGDISLQFETLRQSPEGLKQEVLLKNKDSNRDFQFLITLENTPKYGNVNGGWYFYNNVGQIVFLLPEVYMEDSHGERSDMVLQQIEKNDKGQIILIISPDGEWLDKDYRAWPVKINGTTVLSAS